MAQQQSLWSQSVEIPARERLEKDLRVEAAVIGAGMAGVLIADRLKARGIETVVLEANRIGSGQTRNTTAKITSQHDVLYDALIRKFGRDKARQYAQANEQAIRAYKELIGERGVKCDFCEGPAFLYSQAAAQPMRQEAEAAASLGIAARFTSETELPFSVAGAVRFENQARFHPLKFLKAVSEGLDIYEHTPVASVDGNQIRTENATVTARHIIFAAHFPFVNVPGWYFMRMHQERSYVLALQCDWKPRGMYYGVDNDGLSFREAEGLLLMGGQNHRTGENSQGGCYQKLSSRARELFGDCREAARWSAQDCVTLDGVPYIGRFSASEPRWYVATGFGKWGMTSSMVAAMLIAGEITGEPPEWAEVFSPARFQLSAAAQSLATETVQTLKGRSRELFSIPQTTLDALPAGHGGIVEAKGRKAGVYKDETGQCHVVNPHCPHLGCQLEWNPDEKSWDCPCHGSRFSYDGALLDGPAQTDLEK